MKKLILLSLALLSLNALACPSVEYTNLMCTDGSVIESFKVEDNVIIVKEKGYSEGKIYLPFKQERDDWSIEYSCLGDSIQIKQSSSLVKAENTYTFFKDGLTLSGTELQYGCHNDACTEEGSSYYTKPVYLECK